jgi:hypothetical protein
LNELVEHLVEALREELKQYGEMLALLDHQRKLVLPRHAPELLRSISALREQASVLHIAREEREQRRFHLTRTLNVDESAAFDELLPRLPSVYQPLVHALVAENMQLLLQIHQRAHQNGLLLNQAVDLMAQFVATLPNLENPADSPGPAEPGRRSLPASRNRPSASEPG